MLKNRENPTNFCGSDDSTDDLACPTRQEFPWQPEPARGTTEELWAEYRRLVAHEKALQAHLAQVRAQGSRMANAETFDDRYSLDGVTDKCAITEIRFLNTLKNAPANAADRSEAKDRSVLCWTEGTVQYIAGKGGVVAGRSCKDLFWGYEQLTAIRFDWNFDTSGVTNMCGMFDGCNALASLDLSSLDTSHVTDMSLMFDDCIALTSLDLSCLDISHVTDMSSMFADSTALTSLNLSGWDTSRVTDMGSVFFGCESLEQLNLSG
ncbi:MAG: DUF285 domain-containing protein, partial [Clostridiales bacterium]|nr:DUF285 domain-containing protein [Clostridiales bacterium]